jgi:hypothetical protein
LTKPCRWIKIKNVTKRKLGGPLQPASGQCPLNMEAPPLSVQNPASVWPISIHHASLHRPLEPRGWTAMGAESGRWRRHTRMPVSRATACGGGAACGARGGRLEQGRRPWGQQRSPSPLALGRVGLLPALAATPGAGTKDHPFSLRSNQEGAVRISEEQRSAPASLTCRARP